MLEILNIPSCTAVQLVDSKRILLTTADLSFTTTLEDPTIDLLLHIPPLTIPLSKDSSIVRAHSSKPNTYLFGFDAGIIEITLPADTPEVSATRFESLLVEYGFLTTGLVADADDFVGLVQAAAAKVATAVTDFTEKRLEHEPGVEKRYPASVKNAISGTAEGTGKAAEVTGKAAAAVSKAATSAGEWVSGKVGTNEGVSEAVEAAEVAEGGVSDTTATVRTRVGDSISEIAEHDNGPQAREMVDGARTTVGNVGQITEDLATGTSVVWQAGVAALGAGKAENRME